MNDNNLIHDNEEGTYDPIVSLLNTLINNDIIVIQPVTHIPPPETESSSGQGMSREFIDSLNGFTVSDEFSKKGTQCSICFDDFKEGDKCIELPCSGKKHVFHHSDTCSVMPWLERNNTCPMCRQEFPKEDPIMDTAIVTAAAGLALHSNILEDTIRNIIEGYVNEIRSTEEDDLQRAIELSLNDIS
tara:strand:+ start:206 stop:766 length:561 start_codon:yes stop_codon:yes gene_type:complete